MRTLSPIPLISLILTTTVTACGGGDLTLPVDGSPAALKAMSGGGQQGTIGTQLPNPLVVRLTDGVDRPVAGVAVTFRFQSDAPGAQFEPATATTNDTGFASVRVRLGNTTGNQTVEAAVGANPSSALLATFGVTAVPSNAGGGDPPGRGKRGSGKGKDDDDD